MTDLPLEHLDLPADHFPILFEFLDKGGQVVWSVKAEEPGMVQIPALAQEHGPVDCRVTFGNGRVVESHDD